MTERSVSGPHRAQVVADDHRALRAVVAEIRAALGGRGPRVAQGPDAVAARLDVLRGRLGAHFDEEERVGLFEQIVQVAPEQAPGCARLQAEHLELLARLDELRAARIEARRDEAWGSGVRGILDALADHEARENELLTRVLDGAVEAQD
jgi:hypothetical protein